MSFRVDSSGKKKVKINFHIDKLSKKLLKNN